MDERVESILIPRTQIAARIREMGQQITREIGPLVGGPEAGPLVMMPVLTGAMVFAADLIRHIPVQMTIEPVTVSSYPGKATSSQGASIEGGVPADLGGKHVLVVDDILDSGRTLGLLRRVIEAQRPASVRIAVLLAKEKAEGRDEEVVADYAGFEIEDNFVVGYGLDYDGYYRNLPDIGVLRDPGPPSSTPTSPAQGHAS